jgi:antitoxin component of RelBE/YafQ-DinJ toxin-antitoxin module
VHALQSRFPEKYQQTNGFVARVGGSFDSTAKSNIKSNMGNTMSDGKDLMTSEQVLNQMFPFEENQYYHPETTTIDLNNRSRSKDNQDNSADKDLRSSSDGNN